MTGKKFKSEKFFSGYIFYKEDEISLNENFVSDNLMKTLC